MAQNRMSYKNVVVMEDKGVGYRRMGGVEGHAREVQFRGWTHADASVPVHVTCHLPGSIRLTTKPVSG